MLSLCGQLVANKNSLVISTPHVSAYVPLLPPPRHISTLLLLSYLLQEKTFICLRPIPTNYSKFTSAFHFCYWTTACHLHFVVPIALFCLTSSQPLSAPRVNKFYLLIDYRKTVTTGLGSHARISISRKIGSKFWCVSSGPKKIQSWVRGAAAMVSQGPIICDPDSVQDKNVFPVPRNYANTLCFICYKSRNKCSFPGATNQ